jgi:hypothetical protein
VRLLILWDVVTGFIHRKIEFGDPIEHLAMDEGFGVWVVTGKEIALVTLNGEMAATAQVNEKITAIVALQLKGTLEFRAAICGTEDGRIYLLDPNFQLRNVHFGALVSYHHAEIVEFVLNPSLTQFLSRDVSGVVFVWSAAGVVSPEPVNLQEFAACAVCGTAKPVLRCMSCSQVICDGCVDECDPRICALCGSFSRYL